MSEPDSSNPSRPIQPMPDFVKESLEAGGSMQAHHSRALYQQDDYLSWIDHAKRIETRHRRLQHMLDEPERGKLHMGQILDCRPFACGSFH